MPDFAGKPVVLEAMSRFELRDGLISDYREAVNGGVAMAQLGIAPGRMEKILQRWARELRDRRDVQDYLDDS